MIQFTEIFGAWFSPGSLYVEKLGVSSTAQASLNNFWPMTGGLIMVFDGFGDL